ncbi:integration host factor subunit beta [candidate division KSB1 bacterium]|nr:integration host factor subunit beta [candidate division KSB1 bacterium]
MTKADLVDVISQGTGLTKVETQAVVDGFLATISYALQHGERVDLRGFGNFKIVRRRARTARNPSTNEAVHVPEHNAAIFKPSKDLKEFINRADKAEHDG